MAIRHKRKNSAAYAWQAGDLVEGQIGLNIADGTLHFDKADGSTVTISPGAGGLANVVEDTTPQLGGHLDVNGNAIISTSNGDIELSAHGTGVIKLSSNVRLITGYIEGSTTDGNIELAPNGTGNVLLSADTVRVGDSNANATITTNGTGDLILNTNAGTNSGVITIQDGLDNDITLVPAGTGKVHFETSETRVGIHNTNAKITTKGTGDLTLDTNSGTNSGSIVIADGVNGNITITPDGTGDVNLDADTVRIGDSGAGATLTTNGAGTLTLNTNSGTTTGSIVITQGANGNISLTPNGTGVVLLSGTSIAFVTPTAANQPAITGRSIVTSSATDDRQSVVAQKARTDITFTSMTDEPAVYGFAVRDSTSANRQFGRWIGRYLGTGTNPSFTLRGSPDGFTTNLHYMSIGGGVGTFGSTSSNYTLTSNTGGNLILTANSNTTSGTITIASGTNANISLTPNGTGSVVLDGLNWPQADGTNGQVLTTNGSGQTSWSTVSGSSSQPISVLRATTRTTESGTIYRYNFTELGDSTGITSISTGDITIATSGTYLFEFDANNTSTDPGSSWAIRDVTGSANLRLEDTFFGPVDSRYLIPPMKAVHTITTTNVYAIRQDGGNLHSDIYLKITKLA